MKEYADQRRRSETSGTKVGDVVLIRQPKTNKLSTPFNPHPYKVVARKGSMVTAEHGSHKVTRNVSFFKRIETTPVTENETDDEADDPILSAQHHQEQTAVPSLPRRSQRQRQPPNRLTY
jgi:predicted RNA-binding protein